MTPPPKPPRPPFLDPNPPQYKTPVPTLPHDPLVPHDMGEMLQCDAENRDTERVPSESGENEVSEKFDEETPPDGPFAVRALLKEMKEFKESFTKDFAEMKGHCQAAADNSLSTLATVQSLAKLYTALERRVTAIELADRWVPRLAWLITTVIALVALLRTFKN